MAPTDDGIRSRRELRALVAGGQKHPPDVSSVPPLFESLHFIEENPRGSQRNPLGFLVEMMGFEPMTPCLQGRCSPS